MSQQNNIFKLLVGAGYAASIPILGVIVWKNAVFKVDPGQNAIVFSKVGGMK